MCRNTDISSQTNVARVCDLGLETYRNALRTGPISGEMPECLLELGLLRPLAENPAIFAAVPPDIAASELSRPIERAVLVQQHTIAALYDAVSAADDVYRAEQRNSISPTRALHGGEVIAAALRRAADGCRHEMLAAQPGGSRSPDVLASVLPRDLEMCARGVKQRTLYQHTVRTHGPTLAYIERVSAAGAEIRTLDEIFDRLIVYDRTIAFIPDPRLERNSHALVIEHPGIVHYLATVFDHAWQRAEPVSITQERVRPPLMTNETRRAVLRLMVEGYTDTTIGSRLGISTRTVSHHIKKAADEFGSRSRAQLAYMLAQSEVFTENQD